MSSSSPAVPAHSNGYRLTIVWPSPTWTSKWRCVGPPCVLPVFPARPGYCPAATRMSCNRPGGAGSTGSGRFGRSTAAPEVAVGFTCAHDRPVTRRMPAAPIGRWARCRQHFPCRTRRCRRGWSKPRWRSARCRRSRPTRSRVGCGRVTGRACAPDSCRSAAPRPTNDARRSRGSRTRTRKGVPWITPAAHDPTDCPFRCVETHTAVDVARTFERIAYRTPLHIAVAMCHLEPQIRDEIWRYVPMHTRGDIVDCLQEVPTVSSGRTRAYARELRATLEPG